MISMILIDANVILRFLLEDEKKMHEQAQKLIESGICYTLPEVVAEVIYVLNKVYQVDRAVIRKLLIRLFEKVILENPDVMYAALNIYAERNVDFVDSILIARAKLLRENVFTFDKKVNRIMNEKE